MCGLLGHLGNKENPVNLDKFNILGILNEERGEHSCGVSIDGDILRGVDSLKIYRDFVAFYQLEHPKHTTGIIGHTRKATFGQHTEENAHPFGFGEYKLPKTNELVYKFVGVHNGTLLNHTALANTKNLSVTKLVTEETEVETNGKKKKTVVHRTVTKIDSEILLERLFTDGDYKVLSEYNGAAALIWQDVSQPNKMFFFHGASAKTNYDKEVGEERPLYYWKENKNSLYVSSLLPSLYVIGGTEKEIGEFTCNVVYEVVDGDISKAKKTKIDRSKNYRAEVYVRDYGRGGTEDDGLDNFHGHGNVRANWVERNRQNAYSAVPITGRMGSSSQLQLNLEIPIDKGLLAEKFDYDPDNNLNSGLTMCKQLRYWRNGHLANGIFIYINGFGFHHVGFTQKPSTETVKRLAGMYWYEGDFHLDKPILESVPYCQPIELKRGVNNAVSYLYYMYDGIRMKTYADWQATSADSANGKNRFDLVALSIAAAHPIIDLEESSTKRTPGAYYAGTLANNTYSFLGSNKLYRFTAGQIKDISYIPGMEPEEYSKNKASITTLGRAAAFLEKSLQVNGYTTLAEKDLLRELASLNTVIESLKREGTKVLKISDEVENRIDTILLCYFANGDGDYPTMLTQLNNYKSGSTKAALACDIITKLIQID
ncbi:MAG: class II glutamine amidotransferase [Chitinophagaceae bacterium]